MEYAESGFVQKGAEMYTAPRDKSGDRVIATA